MQNETVTMGGTVPQTKATTSSILGVPFGTLPPPKEEVRRSDQDFDGSTPSQRISRRGHEYRTGAQARIFREMEEQARGAVRDW
jgi:hypothetical protein